MNAYGVASEAKAEFEATGAWPPMEKLTSIEQYALRSKAPGELVLFNTLAGVPGTPIIKSDGVKVKYTGFRLYAISRIPNFERAHTPGAKKSGGRFAVLFKEENGEVTHMETPWIVEPEAQLILKQIGGFEPSKAPFVFEDTYVKLGGDIEFLYRNNGTRKSVLRPCSNQQDDSGNDTTHMRSVKSRPSVVGESSDAIADRTTPFMWGIIGGSVGLLIIALAAWRKLRKPH
jgi:hypothetical protein